MKVSKPLCFWILLLTFFFNFSLAASIPHALADTDAVFDFRKQTLAEPVRLDGNWIFYWHQLLNGTNKPRDKGISLNFPVKWTDYNINGRTYPHFGYATYTCKILLPKQHPALRLSMADAYCAYTLFINGKKVLENGKVTTSANGFEPHWQYKAVNIPENTDTLRLNLQIANFVHSKGGINKSLILGPKSILELTRARSEAIDLLLTGCLLMGAFFFAGLFIMGNRDKAILLFSLFCLDYSYRIIGTTNYVLHTLSPNLNWYVTAFLEYITLFLGVGLFGLYTKNLYPEDGNRYIINILNYTSLSFAAAVVILPTYYYTYLISPFLLVSVYCIIYTPYIYFKAYKKNRPGSLYALLSSFALMGVFLIALLKFWNLAYPSQLFTFGCYVSFFFLQSLTLSHRVSFELKKSREEAEQGLKAKSEFLSTMSHEIRTPLNAVVGMSHLLLKSDPRPDQIDHIDVMLFSANNLLSIVNDILDYNKIEAGKITFEHIEMDIAAIAANIVSSLQTSAEDKGIVLRLVVDELLQKKVMGDPTRIYQVMTNLVHNAIKFTEKGYVEIGLSVVKQTEERITLRMYVKDTGIGISKEKQKLIFERFTQADSSTSRSYGGTGLGLAIGKKILELQNSALEVVSEQGKGATFYFVQTFEKSTKAPLPVEIVPIGIKIEQPLAGKHILLVEDNRMNVLVAQKFLTKWGATSDVAINGVEALDILDTARHSLILMDLQMPIMDGYETAIKMRLNGITTPIIALTANLPSEVEEQVKKTGMNDIVVKPFLPDDLFRKLMHYAYEYQV